LAVRVRYNYSREINGVTRILSCPYSVDINIFMSKDLLKQIAYLVLNFLPLVSVLIAIRNRDRTIAREKAWTVLKPAKNSALLIAGVWSLLLLYVYFSLYPAFVDLYKAFNYPPPVLLRLAPYAIFIGILLTIILAFYIYLSKTIDKEFEENLKHYKDDANIKIRDLFVKRFKLLLICLIILPAIPIAIFAFLPLFQLGI